MRRAVAGCLSGVEADGLRVRAALCFPAELPVFAGHFPGAPLVPGVLLVEAVTAACARALEVALELAEVVDAKFMREVGPGVEVVVTADLTADAGANGSATGSAYGSANGSANGSAYGSPGGAASWACRATVSVPGGEAARLRLRLRATTGGRGCSGS